MKRSVTGPTLSPEGSDTISLDSTRRLEDRMNPQVRMLKKAREMSRDYTVDFQACHMSTTVAQQGKNAGVSWAES